MPSRKSVITIVVLFLTIIIGMKSMFIVEEGNQAITTEFGKIKSTYTKAGINFKAPWYKVDVFPKKILTWNNKPKDIITNDKEYLQVNVTARWKIADPVKFLKSNTNIEGSWSKIDTILDPKIKSVIAAHDRVEVVRSSNQMLEDGYQTSESKAIKTGREEISILIKDGVKDSFVDQGIEIIDIIFKQVRFSDNLTRSVYDRMIKSRNVIAEEYRSSGRGERERIIGETDKELLRISSEARAYEQITKGTADAEAARIYAESYDVDPEFYSFWRALESYKHTLPKFEKTLSTDMEYFQYLYSSK